MFLYVPIPSYLDHGDSSPLIRAPVLLVSPRAPPDPGRSTAARLCRRALGAGIIYDRAG